MCSDAAIGARIRTIFDDEHGLYGAKRIAASLKADTSFDPINHKKEPDRCLGRHHAFVGLRKIVSNYLRWELSTL